MFPLEKEGEDKFQDLVLTIHHCYMHAMMNTPAYKIIENHLGDGMIKMIPQPAPNPGYRPAPPSGEPQPFSQ